METITKLVNTNSKGELVVLCEVDGNFKSTRGENHIIKSIEWEPCMFIVYNILNEEVERYDDSRVKRS